MNFSVIRIPKLKINLNAIKEIKGMLSPEFIFASLLVTFCNLWIYHAKPFVPLYYFYILALINVFVVLHFKKYFILSKCQIMSIVCAVYTLITLFITATEWQYTMHTVTAISCFVIVTIYMRYLNRKQVLTMTNLMLWFNALIISAETYWRLSHPTLSRLDEVIPEDSSFYIFKINSFMIADSNGVALMTMTFIFLAYYLYKNVSNNKIYIFFMMLFFVLTILTISRAAWIATVLTFGIIFSMNFLKKHLYLFIVKHKTTLKFLLFVVFVPAIFIFGFFYVLYLLLQDGSFATKIHLLKCVKIFFCDTSLYKVIFGIGTSLEVSNRLFERYPHNIILIYLTWVGVLGTSLIAYFWWNIYKATNKKAWLIIVPHFFAGISYTMPGLHLFYVALAIMYYFENIEKKALKRRNDALDINCNDNI